MIDNVVIEISLKRILMKLHVLCFISKIQRLFVANSQELVGEGVGGDPGLLNRNVLRLIPEQWW